VLVDSKLVLTIQCFMVIELITKLVIDHLQVGDCGL